MTRDASRFRLGHRPALDGLRAVAILLVFLHHLRIPWPRGGEVGVDLFFVLSGFLITTLLCEEWNEFGRISLAAFYQRRALRLFPALLVLLLFLGIYWNVSPPRPEVLKTYMQALGVSAAYLMNWATALGRIGFTPLSHTWSLANEEQFYLVWPVVLTLLLRSGARRPAVASIVVAGILASTAFRAIHWTGHHDDLRLYYTLDSRADGLLMGALLGLAATGGRLPTRDAPLRAVGVLGTISTLVIVAVAVGGYHDSRVVWYGGLSVVNLAATLLVLSLVCGRFWLARMLEWAPLQWIGRISYGLYLWHYPVCQRYLKSDRPGAGRILLVVALTFALTCLSYYAIERPLLRFKKRPAKPVPVPEPTTSPAVAACSSRAASRGSDPSRRASSTS